MNGENTNTNTTPATPETKPTETTETKPAETTPPAAQGAGETPKTETAAGTETGSGTEQTETQEKPAETQPKTTGPDELDEDILDLAKTPAETDEAKAEEAKAAAAAYLKEAGFEEGIKAMPMGKDSEGNELTMPAEDVGAVVAAMRHAGIPAGKAKDVLATVGALDMIRAERQAAADRETLRAIRKEARDEFGDGLRAAARDMQAGGQAFFGNELWNDICTIPALTNDKRFIRALAGYGRTLRNDDGGPTNAIGGGDKGGVPKFDLKSWMKGTE